jgi:hypothetical protein
VAGEIFTFLILEKVVVCHSFLLILPSRGIPGAVPSKIPASFRLRGG